MSAPVLVLVHGAWHSASCWEPVIPLLKALNHQVFCPDLPGHGKNTADAGRETLKKYTEYINRYIENIGEKVILVGHSMAGMVISQVAENIPDKIERLVYLSAYLPENGQSLFTLIEKNSAAVEKAAIEDAMVISADKRSCTIKPNDIARLFYNHCIGELSQHVPHSLPEEATLPFSGKVSLSKKNFGQVHKTYICCQDDQVIPVSHQRHMMKLQACDEMVQMDSDHSPFLSSPEFLASILHSVSQPVSS